MSYASSVLCSSPRRPGPENSDYLGFASKFAQLNFRAAHKKQLSKSLFALKTHTFKFRGPAVSFLMLPTSKHLEKFNIENLQRKEKKMLSNARDRHMFREKCESSRCFRPPLTRLFKHKMLFLQLCHASPIRGCMLCEMCLSARSLTGAVPCLSALERPLFMTALVPVNSALLCLAHDFTVCLLASVKRMDWCSFSSSSA